MRNIINHKLILLSILAVAALLATILLGCSGKPAAPAAAELMCTEHDVPERLCIICHPELKKDPKFLMCAEHGVPEEICTICHPEVIQKFGLKKICKEHGLPQHLCPKCNPSLSGGEVKSDWCPTHGVPRSLCIRCDPKLAKTTAMCAEHGLPEALCTICRPELAANFLTCTRHNLPIAFCDDPVCRAEAKSAGDAGRLCPVDIGQGQNNDPKGKTQISSIVSTLPLVRLADPDVAKQAGIEIVPAIRAEFSPVVTVNGEVGYDETHFARVRPRVSGILCEVRVKPGDAVRAGDILAVVDSAELGRAKADYLAARPLVDLWKQTVSRNHALDERGIIAGKQVQNAQAELQRAEAELFKTSQQLRNFGLDNRKLDQLDEEPEQDRNHMRILAPLGGTVVRQKAVLGEAVEAAAELFTVADVSRMWIHLDIFEKDLRRIRLGETVIFRVPGLAPAEFTGKISWIDTELNSQTRTIGVRVEAENRDGLLRANMFGSAEIQVGQRRTSFMMPRDAIQWEGTSYVVFVRKDSENYEPRRVLIGQNGGKQMELAWADVKPGEMIVTSGSFLLKTEIQKGSIGAGCCGD